MLFHWRALPSSLLIAGVIALAVGATRLPLLPKYLFYFDNINFALALRDFNPLLHQPHPPGYPLYVGLSKLIHLAVPSAKYTQFVTGVIGSAAALWGVWRLGEELFGPPAGTLALALFFAHPVLLFAGVANPVRTFLSAGSTLVALCVWRAWSRPGGHRWYGWAAVAYGLAGGFRPELLILLLPLLASAAWHQQLARRQVLSGVGWAAAMIACWQIPLVTASGGWQSFLALMRTQASTRQTGFAAWGSMSLYWMLIGVLTWIWALPFTRRLMQRRRIGPQALLLAYWFVPGCLFHLWVTLDWPDHALDVIPVTCLVGGWVLAQLPRPAMPVLAGVALGANALLFVFPPHQTVWTASLGILRYIDTLTADTVDTIRGISAQKPVVIVSNRSLITWRQLSYYFPDVPVIDADVDFRQACPADSVHLVRNQVKTSITTVNGLLSFPSAAQMVWVPPPDPAMVEAVRTSLQLEPHGPVFVSQGGRGQVLQVGACRIRLE